MNLRRCIWCGEREPNAAQAQIAVASQLPLPKCNSAIGRARAEDTCRFVDLPIEIGNLFVKAQELYDERQHVLDELRSLGVTFTWIGGVGGPLLAIEEDAGRYR